MGNGCAQAVAGDVVHVLRVMRCCEVDYTLLCILKLLRTSGVNSNVLRPMCASIIFTKSAKQVISVVHICPLQLVEQCRYKQNT